LKRKEDKKMKNPKPNILHLLRWSMPFLSGYTIRSHYILLHQKKMINPLALTSSDFILKNEPDRIEDVIYYRMPLTIGARLFYQPKLFKKVKISGLYGWINRSILKRPKRTIKKIVKDKKIDIIHGHTPYAFAKWGEYVARKVKIPFIYEVRGFWEDTSVGLGRYRENSFKYKKVQKRETKLMKKADMVITLGFSMKEELIRRGLEEERIAIVPNAVDTEKLIPIELNQDLKKKLGIMDYFVIGYVGTIRKIEWIEGLIRAMKLILNKMNNVVLLLVGNCSKRYHKELLNIIKDLNLSNNILFIGQIPKENVNEYYSIIDINVIPRYNTRVNRLVTPLKPLEVMSMAKVVLTSDLPALKELVKPGISGDLFKTGDYKDLANKIIKYLRNPSARKELGIKARQFVEENYDWSIIATKYKDVYKKFLEPYS